MTWFEELTGITDETPARVYENLSLDGTVIVSDITGWRAETGKLSTPSLSELRESVTPADTGPVDRSGSRRRHTTPAYAPGE
ncbi:hypothetical protein ACEWPN_10910 [Yoonia sp. R2-816]